MGGPSLSYKHPGERSILQTHTSRPDLLQPFSPLCTLRAHSLSLQFPWKRKQNWARWGTCVASQMQAGMSKGRVVEGGGTEWQVWEPILGSSERLPPADENHNNKTFPAPAAPFFIFLSDFTYYSTWNPASQRSVCSNEFSFRDAHISGKVKGHRCLWSRRSLSTSVGLA